MDGIHQLIKTSHKGSESSRIQIQQDHLWQALDCGARLVIGYAEQHLDIAYNGSGVRDLPHQLNYAYKSLSAFRLTPIMMNKNFLPSNIKRSCAMYKACKKDVPSAEFKLGKIAEERGHAIPRTPQCQCHCKYTAEQTGIAPN